MIDLNKIAKAEMAKTSEIILPFPWHDPKAYGMWLAQTYYMVCYSTRLVAMAGAFCELDQDRLHARFVDHSKEERGHEKICINDIKNLGYKLEDFPQLYQSASMYQIQYYWIQHKGPVSFFGYTLALELLATEFGKEVYKRVREAHGDKASVFLKVHAEEDVDHIESAFKQLSALKPHELELVVENFRLSGDIYRGMLTEIQARMQHIRVQKAA